LHNNFRRTVIYIKPLWQEQCLGAELKGNITGSVGGISAGSGAENIGYRRKTADEAGKAIV
jgi:hypothetical protein